MSIGKELNELLHLNTIVETLLRSNAMYRDCDKKLCARIWSHQMGGTNVVERISAYDFLVEYTKPNSKLYSQESIGRARRKLQEENPELRGTKYRQRQEESRPVQLSLGYNV
jgi:hypothetical protein